MLYIVAESLNPLVENVRQAEGLEMDLGKLNPLESVTGRVES
jgi:hypothetical protein